MTDETLKTIITSLTPEQFPSYDVDPDFPDDHDERVIAEDSPTHSHRCSFPTHTDAIVIKHYLEEHRLLDPPIGSGISPEEHQSAIRRQNDRLEELKHLQQRLDDELKGQQP